MQASRAAAWNTQELHTWYQKHLHALKVGEHRDRIRSDGISKGVDNSTPRHYHTYLKSKYGIDPSTINMNRKAKIKTRHSKHNRQNRQNRQNHKPKSVKNAGKHLRHRSKSNFATPSHNKMSSGKQLSKHASSQSHCRLPETRSTETKITRRVKDCRVRVPLKEKERIQNINKQNLLLKTRINNIRPSKYLAQAKMTEHWKRHSQYRNKFLSNRDKVRQYPDVLSKQKLLKSLTAIQSKSVTNIATCNQSPDRHDKDRPQGSVEMPSVTISSNSVLNVKYSDIMSMRKKKPKTREKRLQANNHTHTQSTQIVPRNAKRSKHQKQTQLPSLNSPNGVKKVKKRVGHKPKSKNLKVIESTNDIN